MKCIFQSMMRVSNAKAAMPKIAVAPANCTRLPERQSIAPQYRF
jgi:hypothetical protein